MLENKEKFLGIFLGAIAFFSVATLCKAAELDSVVLGLNWKAEPEFGGFYYAKDKHWDQENGIDLQIKEGGAGTPTIQMIASGKIDYGIVSADELVLARNNGADVVAVYAVFQKSPYALMVRESLGVNSIKELFQKKINLAVVKGLPFVSFLEKKYSAEKKLTTVPYLGGITHFLAKEDYAQQCFASSEPLLAANNGVKVKTFLVADEGFDPYVVVLATQGKRVKEKQAQVERVIKSVRQGWNGYLKSPEFVFSTLTKFNPTLDPKSLKKMSEIEKKFIESSVAKGDHLGSMSEVRWDTLQKQLKDLNLISKLSNPNDYFKNIK